MILMWFCVILTFAGSFGRRASDGGANLHIYYPASGSGGSGACDPIEGLYSSSNNTNNNNISPTSRECLRITQGEMSGVSGVSRGVSDLNTVAMEGNDESNDEIKRCESECYLLLLFFSCFTFWPIYHNWGRCMNVLMFL